MKDGVDSAVMAENRRLKRMIEKYRSDRKALIKIHDSEILKKDTDVAILKEEVRVRDKTIQLQALAIENENERRKAEIAASIGLQGGFIKEAPRG